MLASTLAATKGEDEYGRHQILVTLIPHPYASAARNLPKYVSSVKRHNDKAERAKQARRERAAAARERAAQARRAAAAQRQSNSGSAGGGSSSSSSSKPKSSGGSSSASGGGSYPGYTGPRCYAPGGKTWKPC